MKIAVANVVVVDPKNRNELLVWQRTSRCDSLFFF